MSTMCAPMPDLVALFDLQPPSWQDAAEDAFMRLAKTGVPFTIDDVHALGVPEPGVANSWGAAVQALRARGVIRWTGEFRPSIRESRHGNPVRVWIGVMA